MALSRFGCSADKKKRAIPLRGFYLLALCLLVRIGSPSSLPPPSYYSGSDPKENQTLTDGIRP